MPLMPKAVSTTTVPHEHARHDQAAHGDDRAERVAQDVAADDLALRDAGGSGRLDVVGGRRVRHGLPGDAADQGERAEGQGQGGEGEVVEGSGESRAGPGHREPAQLDAEEGDQRDRSHERRHRRGEGRTPTTAESTHVDCLTAARMPAPTPRTTNNKVA